MRRSFDPSAASFDFSAASHDPSAASYAPPTTAGNASPESASAPKSPSPPAAASPSTAVSPGSPKRGNRQPSASDPRSLREVLPSAQFVGAEDIVFRGVADSGSAVAAGELAIHRVGSGDPLRLAADAMARGCAGIVTEQLLPCSLPQCVVGDVDSAAAAIRATLLDRPDRRLLTVGVAGSAGKSTTALLIATLVRSLGVRTAYLTDLGASDGVISSTPSDPVPDGEAVVEWMGEAVDTGCEVAIVEMPEDPLRHGGYDAIELDVLVLTGALDPRNDFGPTSLQCAIERLADNGAVIVPADDPRVERLVRDSGVAMVTYGVRKSAEVTVKLIEQTDGMTTSFLCQGDTTAVMESSLCGGAMAANHAAAATFGILIGQPLTGIAEALGSLRGVPGRLQQVSGGVDAKVVVDAAGTTRRATEALRAARAMRQTGRLWCVLAIDGSESPEQLARYGRLAERFADHAILTSAESAKPDFLALSHHVLDGVKRCASLRLVANREAAVRWAVRHANPRDLILVLGGVSAPDAQQERQRIAEIERWVESERERRDASGRDRRNAEGGAANGSAPAFRVVG